MKTLRLLLVDRPDARIASFGNASVSAGRFVAQAEHIAKEMPRAAHVCSLPAARAVVPLVPGTVTARVALGAPIAP
jgi:hypothetical protein